MTLTQENLILAFLKLNDEEPIQSISKFQLLVLLAQNGGLGTDPVDPIEEVFPYSGNSSGKPYSEQLTKELTRLNQSGYISQTNNEYSITERGRENIDPVDSFSKDHLRAIKLTKELYNKTPSEELLDKFNS